MTRYLTTVVYTRYGRRCAALVAPLAPSRDAAEYEAGGIVGRTPGVRVDYVRAVGIASDSTARRKLTAILG